MKDENVLCVSLYQLQETFDMTKDFWHIDSNQIDVLSPTYIHRAEAEINFQNKQVIPYAIVKNKQGELLCYQRHGSETRLSGVFSVGIGGHVNDEDKGKTMCECILAGLKRECMEEIGVDLNNNQIQLKGMINEEQTEVGHCHIGVVFLIEVDEGNLHIDDEIANPQWMTLESIELENFELWSSLALQLIK